MFGLQLGLHRYLAAVAAVMSHLGLMTWARGCRDSNMEALYHKDWRLDKETGTQMQQGVGRRREAESVGMKQRLEGGATDISNERMRRGRVAGARTVRAKG